MTDDSVDWSKELPARRIKKIEEVYVLSPDLREILKTIEHCHHYSRNSKEPKCLLIMGRPGVGKTSLSEYYLKDYPRVDTGEQVEVPVLYVQIELPATPKNLVSSLLTALGDPAAEKGNIGSQTRRLRTFLKRLKTELIFLDDFQHFIDRDSLKVLKTISDWLKVLIDSTKIPVVLMGMPYSHIILDTRGNEQLRRRFLLRRIIEPFGWGGSSEEQENFRSFLKLLDAKLPFNKRSNLSGQVSAFRLYCAANGVPSYVMEIVRTAAANAVTRSFESITLELLAEAYEQSLASAYPDRENPFLSDFNELEIVPFDDWLPSLKNLKELNEKGDSAADVLRRK